MTARMRVMSAAGPLGTEGKARTQNPMSVSAVPTVAGAMALTRSAPGRTNVAMEEMAMTIPPAIQAPPGVVASAKETAAAPPSRGAVCASARPPAGLVRATRVATPVAMTAAKPAMMALSRF